METGQLIASLRGDLQPVRPLRPPWLRATLWLLGVGLLATLVVLRYAPAGLFTQRTAVPRVALECVGALLTAVVSIAAAFNLSIPGRAESWRWAPVPPLLLWLGASGLGCLHNGLGMGPPGERIGESGGCFRFIVMVSVPLAVLLFAALRRAQPLAPLRVAACGALGVAALAAFVLQFFHPFDTTVIDLGMHALAVAAVVGVAALLRRRGLASA